MDRRGLLETGGVALVSGVVTAGLLRASVGWIQWSLVLGVVAAAAIAAAANYRGRTGHAESVAETAPPGPATAPEHGEAATEYVVSAAPQDAAPAGPDDDAAGEAPSDAAAEDGGEGRQRPDAGDGSDAATATDPAGAGDDRRADGGAASSAGRASSGGSPDGGEGAAADRVLGRAPDA